MPYLHWETEKTRRKMAEAIRTTTHKYQREGRQELWPNKEFRAEFQEAIKGTQIKYSKRAQSELVAKKPAEYTKFSPLGEYFMSVAKVFAAMDIEPDLRALRDRLYEDPPLHPRRTLDQSYYLRSEDTRGRHDDQVVYRGTKAGRIKFQTAKVVMVDQLWLYILDDSTFLN